MTGEVVYFNVFPRQGMYIYDGTGWIPIFSTQNNIWEDQLAQKAQVIFELKNQYNTDGKSIVVYKDGRRLEKHMFAEIGPNMVAYKELDEEGEDIELQGGEHFEFQIFNSKIHGVFDIRAFNRRVGVC